MKKTRKRITEDRFYNALTALMERKSYEDITISAISDEAGISRMTFYRNFKSKDDILVSHLNSVIEDIKKNFMAGSDLSEKNFWYEMIRASRSDPLNEHLMAAGLFEKTITSQLDFILSVYRDYFGLDLTDQDSVVFVYRKLGAVFGCLFYAALHKGFSMEILTKHLDTIIGEKNN